MLRKTSLTFKIVQILEVPHALILGYVSVLRPLGPLKGGLGERGRRRLPTTIRTIMVGRLAPPLDFDGQ